MSAASFETAIEETSGDRGGFSKGWQARSFQLIWRINLDVRTVEITGGTEIDTTHPILFAF